MNIVEIRDAIVAHLEILLTQWDTEGRAVPVFMENQDIDLHSVGDEFIYFCIDWRDSAQKNVAFNPDVRYYGDIFVVLMGKNNSGTRNRMVREVEISEHFKFKGLAGVQVEKPTPSAAPGRPGNIAGWHATAVKFPFYADSDT